MARRPNAIAAAATASSCALVVVAKAPIGGAAAPLLESAFLRDTLDKARHPSVGAHVTLAVDGDPEARLPDNLPGDVPRTRQIGNDPGARLVQITEDRLHEGARLVVVIGGDAPHLPAAFLAEAFGRLGHGGEAAADVVLGPCEDGDCYLIGLRGAHAPRLFRDLPRDTNAVFAVTHERARALDLRVAFLPRWYGIRTGADLERLRRDLSRGVVEAPHTAQALRGSAQRGSTAAG